MVRVSARFNTPLSIAGNSSAKALTSSGRHLHIPTGELGVEFRAAFLTPAVLNYGVDELIDSRRLRQLRDLVAEPLGFLF